MQEEINPTKQLPFKEIKPVKLIGINTELPFNSIISESKLLYFGGRTLILENIKTSEQKIIWTNQYDQSPSAIEHIRNMQQQNIVGIACRDNQGSHIAIIISINSAINNYELFSGKEKEKDKMHYLKDINEDDKIVGLRFLQQGGLFTVISETAREQKGRSHKNICVYSAFSGDKLYSTDFVSRHPIVETLQLHRKNYVCIMKNQPEQQQNKLLIQKISFSEKQSKKYSNQKIKSSLFVINLLNSSELSINNSFTILLEQGQFVLQVTFVENNNKMICFMLLNSGFVLGFIVSERGFHESVRIDVRIDKDEHLERVKAKEKQNDLQNAVDLHQTNNQFDQIFSPSAKDKQHNKSSSKRFHDNNPKSVHYMPLCISCSNSKVVIGYEGCSFIGVIQYSGVSHHKYKFWYIDDFFTQRPQINSIKKIIFSQDGCHCSVLVGVGSINQPLYNKPFTKVSFQLDQNDDDVQMGALNNEGEDNLLFQREYFDLLLIDFVSGLIEHSYHNESIQESLICCSLNGTVQCVEFNLKNNTAFVFMSDNRLCFCTMDFSKVAQTEKISQQSVNLTKTNKEMTTFTQQPQTQKALATNLLPQSMLFWTDKKGKPFLIISHPIVFQLVLVYQDCVKFHFYNFDKLFDSHYALSLKNCRAASYSPFGDKLALGTLGSIWVMDSYTYAVIKKVALVIFPTEIANKSSQSKQLKKKLPSRANSVVGSSAKTVSKIQYINNFDLMIQTGNTTLSILLNYQKNLFFGYTSQPISGHLFSFDSKLNLGVIASQYCVKVIKKSTINSKNRCEQLVKIDIAISSFKLCEQIGVLFLGGKNGVLYFVRWPDFFQNESTKYPTLNKKLYLFHSPIVDIQISINYKQLFVTSESGMVIICDLIHSDEVQKIGKDISFRISKKIDYQLFLMNKWLVSMSERQRHAQKVTKLMGNEAEIKINEASFPENYKLNLQKQLQDERTRLGELLKSEIKKYEKDSGISKLQIDIVLTKDEIRTIKRKKQSQSRQLNEKIDSDLHKVFLQKQELQNELKQVRIRNQLDKETVLHDQLNILITQDQNRQKQTHQITDMQYGQQRYYQQRIKRDIGMKQTMHQEFEDEIKENQLFYGGELMEIENKNNLLGQQYRRMNIESLEMREKMKEVTVRMEELESDVEEVEKQAYKLAQTKSRLQQQIMQTDKNYHQLIKRTKEIEMTLNKTRTSSEACQLRYDQMEKQINILKDNLNFLQSKSQQNTNDFVEQYNCRNVSFIQQQELKMKIVKLKARRKQLFQRKVLLKDLLREYEKQSPQKRSDQNAHFGENESIEFKKTRAYKLNYDVDKWLKVNQDIKINTKKHAEKLQQQTCKLIYRHNELMKQHKDLINTQNNLQKSIAIQKQRLTHSTTNTANYREKFTFVPVPKNVQQQSTPKTKIRKHLSIDRQSFIKDKFSSKNSYFSPSHSVQRENNERNTTTASQIKSFLKFQGQQHIDTSSRLFSKTSNKNLHPITYQKKAKLKELTKKQNASLYHGVTLDPKTLKPNKTLCISLHKAGQDTKFITEY